MAQLCPGSGGEIVTRVSDNRSGDQAIAPRPVRVTRPASHGVFEHLEERRLLSTWYVSPSGSDDAGGSSLGAPFRTIQRAADAANPGDTVLVRGGTYRETVTPRRSGTASAPITFKPYNGERVTVSGADPVTGWARHGGSVYKAPQSWDLGFGNNQVFVDGRMMIEARWPNTTLDVSRPRKATMDDVDAGGSSGTLEDSALTHGDGYWDGAVIHFAPGQGWVTQTGRVTDSSPGRLSFSFDHMGRKAGPETGDPYFLTGKFKALDSPAEWFRDGSGTLYLWTEDSDDPSGHTVEAKRRELAFDLSNRQHVTVEGFEIFAASIHSNGGSSHLVLSGLTASYLSHWTLQDTGWGQPHDSGIYLDGEDSVIKDSVISFSAGHGIVLAGENNRAENNLVRDVAYNGGDSAGIRTVGSGHVITRNTVYNTGRSGIKASNSTDLTITRNVIHDVMLQTTDGGGIYTFGMDGRGTEIAYNRIYNARAGGYGGVGVFLDNNSSNYVLHHNLVWNVNHALKLNYTSRGHRIYNNTLSGVDSSVGTSSGSRMPGTVFKNNIFTADADIAGDATQSRNIYSGTDARFEDESRNDFDLSSNSPAVDAGSAISPYTNGYAGSAPDIGALERGRSAVSAGANLSARTPDRPPASRPGGGGAPEPSDPSAPPPVDEPPPPPSPPMGPAVALPPAEGISVAEVSPVRLPEKIIAGQRNARGRVKVVLRNEGTMPAAAAVTVALLASADAAPQPGVDVALGRLARRVKLAPGKSRAFVVPVRFTDPTATADYLLLASAAGEGVSVKNVVSGLAPLRIEAPTVALVAQPPAAPPAPLQLSPGGRLSLTVPLVNQGNVASSDPVNVELRASPDGTLANSVLLTTLPKRRLAIRPGATKPLLLSFRLGKSAAISPGLYTLLARLGASDQPVISVPVTVG